MELSSPKLKKTPVFFFRRTLRAFHHCFFRCFNFTTDFYYCFSSVFISPTFFTVIVFFLSGTSFLCYCTASATDLREHFFTFRHFFPQTPFIHLLRYRKGYRFEWALFIVRRFFTLHSFLTFTKVQRVLRISKSPFYCQMFLTLHSFPTFATVPRVLRIWESIFYSQGFLPYTPSQHLAQPAFIKTPLRANNSPLKVAEPLPEVQNTDPAHVFVWITQCSVKGISW